MSGTEVNGSPTAMSTFATGLTAPAMPASLARLGTPPNLSGLIEGIAMSLLDKAATAEVSAYLSKVGQDMASYSVRTNTAAASYATSDVDSGLELVTAGAKFGQEAISFVKQLSSGASGSSGSSATSGSTAPGIAQTQQPGQIAPSTTNPIAGNGSQASV